jgi:hypothetical protein
MTPAARVAAAIEVLGEIETRRRPAADAMKDWGFAHRFAGSGDRAAISSLVYDALRGETLSPLAFATRASRSQCLVVGGNEANDSRAQRAARQDNVAPRAIGARRGEDLSDVIVRLAAGESG